MGSLMNEESDWVVLYLDPHYEVWGCGGGQRTRGTAGERERTVETDIMYEYRYCAIILN